MPPPNSPNSPANAIMSQSGSGQGSNIPANGDGSTPLLSWLQKTYPDVREAFTSYHQNCLEAVLMYAGQTWTKWNSTTKAFDMEEPQDNWTPMPRINKFSPTIDSITPNFNEVPEVDAIPVDEDGDPMAWGIADVASSLASDWATKQGLRGDFNGQEDKPGVAAQTLVLMGALFTRVMKYPLSTLNQPIMSPQPVMQASCPTCDQFHPDMQPIPGTQSYACPGCNNQLTPTQGVGLKPQLDPMGQPMSQPVTLWDACCEIGLPIYALPRPGATGMHNCPFFIWAERRSLDWINEETGFDADADTEQIDGQSVSLEHAIQYFYQGVNQTSSRLKDSAMVVECFIEPGKCKDQPNGGYGMMVNGQMIKELEWSEFYDHPLTMIPYQKIPTLFHARAVSFELTGLQKEYQQYRSIIKLHAMTSAVDPIILDENTIVTQPTGRADKIIKWRSIGPGGKEPHRMVHGSLDEAVYKESSYIDQQFENVSGAVAVQRGEQPGSITAASGIAQLRGQAQMVYNKPQGNWNAGWKETIRKGVKIRQQLWSEAQICEVVGIDKLAFVQAFKAADLDKVVKWVPSAHGLPRTRDERKAEMMQLYDAGALDLTDVVVREKIFELFGETGIMSSFNLDATRARLENKTFKTLQPGTPGPVPKPYPMEDCQVHLGIHLQQLKSLEFDQWPPPQQQAFIQHVEITAQNLQQQMMMQNPQPAPGPQKGAPPAPGGARDTTSAQ